MYDFYDIEPTPCIELSDRQIGYVSIAFMATLNKIEPYANAAHIGFMWNLYAKDAIIIRFNEEQLIIRFDYDKLKGTWMEKYIPTLKSTWKQEPNDDR